MLMRNVEEGMPEVIKRKIKETNKKRVAYDAKASTKDIGNQKNSLTCYAQAVVSSRIPQATVSLAHLDMGRVVRKPMWLVSTKSKAESPSSVSVTGARPAMDLEGSVYGRQQSLSPLC